MDTTLYGKPCDYWDRYQPVIGKYYSIRGHIISRRFVYDNGTDSKYRGEVVNGTCYMVQRKQYIQGSCSNPDWFDSDTGQCDIRCKLPYGCVNLTADCGIDPHTSNPILSCCVNITQSCRAVHWVAKTCRIDQYDDVKDKEVCCGGTCCHLNNAVSSTSCQIETTDDYCSVDNATSIRFHRYDANTTLCCNDTCCNNIVYNDGIYVNDLYLKTNYPDKSCCAAVNETCCTLSHSTSTCCSGGTEAVTTIAEYSCYATECKQDVETCYVYVNLTGWYVDFSMKKVYDVDRNLRDEYYVNCNLTLLEDVSIYPEDEPLQFNKPTKSRNYCRNPNGNTERGLWCYTSDSSTRWQWCDLPFCPGKLCCYY